MCDYIKNRFHDEKIMPVRDDIKILEILKKIVESGWILGKSEFKQVLNFLNIKGRDAITGKDKLLLRSYIEKIIVEFRVKGIPPNLDEFIE